ncbi:eukaryotic translation elongation factor 1 epsilon-1 [Galleria mellonella]|uniref:Eukaryotic translation elongation factor 1 epsilon-1 n=1 Tax=Galleria mellonella TaxID=7137 RepID=A0A6J1X801_GALME|nr:eukaryotic translation elongation factor 1 epsilon-1 [Galleria mellonella]
MSACNVEVIKLIGKYLNTPVGPVCYNTDRVLTTVLDKQNVDGFASIVLRLVSKNENKMSQDKLLASYQWLEHIAMFSNQAITNPIFAKNFLQDINKALEKSTYLTGDFLNITDIAAYYVLYPLIERLTISERESLLHLCRWSKHIQAQPKVCASKPPLHLNTLTLSVLAPTVVH